MEKAAEKSSLEKYCAMMRHTSDAMRRRSAQLAVNQVRELAARKDRENRDWLTDRAR